MTEFDQEQEKEFVNLLVSHQPLIRAFIISQLPGAPEADDVIQQTNEVLWAKRRSFTLGTNFKAWAMTTARFQVMAHRQRIKAARLSSLDNDVLMMVADEAVEVMDGDDMHRKMQELNECLSMLHVRDQELILHRYWKKSGLMDYAQATSRSVGSLKVALFRVRERLRECMDRKLKQREGLA